MKHSKPIEHLKHLEHLERLEHLKILKCSSVKHFQNKRYYFFTQSYVILGPKYSNGKNKYIGTDGGTAESSRGSVLCDQRRTGGRSSSLKV